MSIARIIFGSRIGILLPLLSVFAASANAAPSIRSLSVSSGPVGTGVTLTGTGFGSSQGTGTVAFNGTNATVTSWSGTSIAVTVPAAATTGNVVVTVSGVASNGKTFTVTPHITSLSITSGAVGASVTITGTTFGGTQGTSTVKFSTTNATPTSWSATSIVVPVPTGATTGNVVVTVSSQASNGVSFTVVAAPSITSLSVSSGPVGAAVTITGTGFGSSQGTGTVAFNGTNATVTTWSATSIAVTVPAAATTGNVVVNASGVASNGKSFTVVPHIASLSITSGAVGASVTITGTTFGGTQGTSTVTFNGSTATPTSWSATSIVVPVPTGATTGNVAVTVSSQASNGVNFTVVPHIASLSITSGAVGASVTITGTTFGGTQGTSTVAFNGTIATPTTWSASSIVVPVPTGATTGNVVVTVSGQASNGVSFTVFATPSITSLSPSSGSVGTAVTIAGTNFGSSQGTSTVTFRGILATPSSWSATSIVVPVPNGATSGSVQVTVNGVASNGSSFILSSLPTGWLDGDVGSANAPGSAVYGSDVFTVASTGSGIGGGNGSSTTTDGFHFVYQSLSGDGTIVARLVSLQGGWSAEAGVMIRETLGTGSNNVFLNAQALSNPYLNIFDRTTTSGSESNPTSIAVSSLPYWFKLARSGNTFTAYTGLDGVNWTQMGSSQTVTMAQNVYIGIAVTGQGNGAEAASATLDNVGVNSTVAPGPVISGLSATTGPIGSQVVVSGSAFGATQGNSLVTLNTSPVTINSWSNTSITITIPTGATSGHLVVTAAPGMNDSNPVVFTITPNPLPAGWLDLDIGPAGAPGTATYSSAIFTLNSAGSGVGGVNGSSETIDGLHFVYKPLPGDGEIVARITSLQAGGWASQAGLMIRETLDEGSTNVFLTTVAVSSTDLYFFDRTSEGVNESNPTTTFLPSFPYWLKLTRSGSAFATYTSPDGINWSQLGSSVSITMAQNVYIGLACTGANNGASLTTSTFDDVSLTTTAMGAPVIGSLSATTGSVGTPVTLSGSGFGATQGASLVTLNSTPVTVDSWSDSSITITIPVGATSGLLVVSVAPTMNDSNGAFFEVTSTPLPSGWLDQDVGAVGITGSATYANGTFAIQGGGYGIGGTPSGLGGPSDSFHFVYQALQGDGTIIARVVTEPGTTGLAGVVFRAVVGDTSPLNAYAAYFPQNTDVLFLDRPAEGASEAISGSSAAVSLPYWVKLVRSGSVFSAYASVDASNWVQVGTSQTIAMPATAFVGLAVSGHSTSVLGTATIDNVSVSSTQNPGPVITAISSTTGSVGSQVVVSGAGFGESQASSHVLLNDVPVTVNSWSQNSITITIPTGATSGPLVVSVGVGMNNSNAVQFTVTPNPLPSGWLDQDVGTVAVQGSASYSNGTFTVNGAGLGVGGTGSGYGGQQDSFHFVYEPLAGNGTIIARIVTNPGTDGQAGIMIREGLDTGALNAFLANFPQDTSALVFERPSTGSGETSANGAGFTLPYWVKLIRNGASFSSYTSSDGTTWTQLGSALSIPMGQNVYIGLGVSGGLDNTLSTATFDNVSATFGGWGTSPTITGLSPTTGSYGTSVTISGSGFGSTQGTSSVTFNGTTVTPCGTCWSSTSITVTVPNGTTTGSVIVTVGGIASNGVNFGVFNPVIAAIAPAAAQIGATVVLTGSGFGTFQGASQLQFNGVTASVISWGDTSISALVPNGATSGSVNLSEQGVTSNNISFSVESLSVTGISPNFGPAGTFVTISGTGFGPTQTSSTVDFYGTSAAVQSWSDTQIVAIVPQGAASGSTDVTVGSVVWYGPQFTMTRGIQITDSNGHSSTYTSAMIGGQWVPSATQGSGCSTCTERGNISYTYDSAGHPLTRTDENGNTTTYTYDGNGNVLTSSVPISPGHTATTTFTYNSFGEVLTVTDPLGNVTTYSYDASGDLLSVTTPAPGNGASASVTQFAYDNKGELTSVTDPLGNQTSVAYFPTGLIKTITDAQSHVITFAYDTQGNRTSITDANNKQTTFTYDGMNRLTKITYPDTTTAQFGYDNRGRRTSVTDQNSKTTAYTYDDADRLLTVTDAASNVTTYGYDSESNLTSIKDANNNTTSFAYDAFGRVTQTTFPSGFVETYGYDNVGNLTSKTDRKNQLINYSYDQLNRLTEKSYPDTSSVNYTYDNDSRLTQVTDPTGTYQLTFDNMGRLTGTTSSYSFLTTRNFTTAYTYDAASNRAGFTDPENGSTSYVYDTLNRLQTLTPPSTFGTGSFGLSYDALSRRTQMTRPNGVSTNYTFDNLSRLLSVLHQSGSTTLDGASYTVDNVGNRLTRTPQPSGPASTFGYDNIYELLSVVQSSTTTESYTYDPVGNRLSNLGGSGWANNTSNELTSRPGVTYTYDNNGNTLTNVASSGTTTYAWDFENRLTSVTLPASGGTVTFKYDPFGRRIYKSSTSGTSIYAYDRNNLIEETNSSGAAVARYSQGLDIDEPLAELRSGVTSYYEADGLGSITSLTNSAGAVANTYNYDSFGNLIASTGTLNNPFRYTGREFDPETNLHYYRARYYDPIAGRFLNEDPIGFTGGINRYAYTLNNPALWIDPFGLCLTPWNRFMLGVNGSFQLAVAGGKIIEAVGGVAAAPETGGFSLALSVYAGASSLQNLITAAADFGGALTGDEETTEQFEQYAPAFGTGSGITTYAITHNVNTAATAGNIEGLFMLGLSAGGVRPQLDLPDILNSPKPGLPEVSPIIKGYDGLDTGKSALFPKQKGPESPKSNCVCN